MGITLLQKSSNSGASPCIGGPAESGSNNALKAAAAEPNNNTSTMNNNNNTSSNNNNNKSTGRADYSINSNNGNGKGTAVSYDNRVGEFYRSSHIFITGGTGFVGKALIEKLLRTCDLVDTVYLLIRNKKGMKADQRLRELFKNPVFGKIKEKDPSLLDKVKAIEGDVSVPGMGLSETDRQKLIENVDIVFHSAATVKFNENLRTAVTLNMIGTQRVIELCSQMRRLKSFVHVSTAFSNADKKTVDEIVYKPCVDPNWIIDAVQTLPNDALDAFADKLLENHPNTYTLTKAMAEYMVLEASAGIPTCIVRPSIVCGSWKEPFPGWVDSVSGISGIMMEIGRGSIKSIIGAGVNVMDLIPVDIVVNTMVVSAWHTVANRSNVMRVYNCTSGSINKVLWNEWGQMTVRSALMYPSKYLTWYPGFTYRTNRVIHWICSVLFHTVPACLADLILLCTNHKPMMYNISKKFERACKNGEFFAMNEWEFKIGSLLLLSKDLKRSGDGRDYNLDISRENGFEWEPFNQSYMLGIRQFVLKDDLSSLPQAKARLNKFYWINKAIQLCAMYLLLKLTIL